MIDRRVKSINEIGVNKFLNMATALLANSVQFDDSARNLSIKKAYKVGESIGVHIVAKWWKYIEAQNTLRSPPLCG
ncbi:MAG: hypothetical protein WCP45_01030 [Verrucomicrobiota bacterium]